MATTNRTLVHVLDIIDDRVMLSIPGWRSRWFVERTLDIFALELRETVTRDSYYFGQVNVGVERSEDLTIEVTEIAPPVHPDDADELPVAEEQLARALEKLEQKERDHSIQKNILGAALGDREASMHAATRLQMELLKALCMPDSERVAPSATIAAQIDNARRLVQVLVDERDAFRRARNIDRASIDLKDQTLNEVRAALQDGRDEALWPPGKTLGEAIDLLVTRAQEPKSVVMADLELVTWAAQRRVLHLAEPPAALKPLVEAVLAWLADAQARPAEAVVASYLGTDEGRELGLVVEINRRVLHPVGLAAEVMDVGPSTFHLRVQDHRDDLEGMVYDPLPVEKIEAYRELVESRRDHRQAALGYFIQPTHPEDQRAMHVAQQGGSAFKLGHTRDQNPHAAGPDRESWFYGFDAMAWEAKGCTCDNPPPHPGAEGVFHTSDDCPIHGDEDDIKEEPVP